MTSRLITAVDRWEPANCHETEFRAGIALRPVELMGGKAGSLWRCENEEEEMADERERGSGYKIDDVSASVIRNTSIPFVSLHFDAGGGYMYIYIYVR